MRSFFKASLLTSLLLTNLYWGFCVSSNEDAQGSLMHKKRKSDVLDDFVEVSESGTGLIVDLTSVDQSKAPEFNFNAYKKKFMSALIKDDLEELRKVTGDVRVADFEISSPLNPGLRTFPLHFALLHGLTKSAVFIARNLKFNPNVADCSGHTPLSLCLDIGNRDCFEILVKISNLSAPIMNGIQVIHFAAALPFSKDPIFYLKSLVRNTTSLLEVCKKNQWSPLKYAAMADNVEVATWMVEHFHENTSESLLEQSENHEIILEVVQHGPPRMVKFLLEWAAQVEAIDNNGRNILHLAVIRGDKQILHDIVSYLSEDETRELLNSIEYELEYAPIHFAAAKDSLSILKFLAKYSDETILTDNDQSILTISVTKECEKVFRYCLEKGYLQDTEMHGSFALAVKAFQNESSQMVKEILLHSSQDSHYNFDENGYNIAHWAVLGADVDLIEFLIDLKFDFNRMDNLLSDPQAPSPLAWAIFLQAPEICKLLLDNGAHVHEALDPKLFKNPAVEDVIEASLFRMELKAETLFELAERIGNQEIIQMLHS